MKLREQPFQILLALLGTPGEVVSRETLRERLWGESTFVDFENGLNSAISRLREALDDVSTKPVWIETVPKRGYRFVGPVPRPSAGAAYLKGHHVISPHSPESMRKSLAFFEESIQLDPSYPMAYHGAALVYILRCLLDDLRPLEALPKAEEFLMKGLQCPQKAAMVYNTLAMLRTFERRWAEADDASSKAIALEPDNPYVRMIRAQLLSCLGEHDQAIGEANKAVDLDPTHPRTHMHLVRALYYARRFEECVRAGHSGLEVCPDPYVGFYTCFALIAMGRAEDAVKVAEKVQRRGTLQAVESAMGAFIAASAGRRDNAVGVLLMLKERRKNSYVPAIAIAWLELALHNFESCFDWLAVACREGEPYLASAKISPAYDPLRKHERFETFVRELVSR